MERRTTARSNVQRSQFLWFEAVSQRWLAFASTVEMSELNKQVVVMPLAFAMIAMHSCKYRTAQVHGLLIGSIDSGKVHVSDTLPICHEAPTKSIIESGISVALSTIHAEAGRKHVLGWYTVPELIGDDRPGAAALRIVASLENLITKPVLLSVSKMGVEKFAEAADVGFHGEHVTAFGKDFGMQWQERLPIDCRSLSIDEMCGIRAFIDDEQFCDLTDHWLSPSCTEWPKPSNVQSITEKLWR